MGVYVLVHGAWHGGWCWSRVAALLRERGHVVHTPTLNGLGDRSHHAHKDVDLAAHIRDVVAALVAEDVADAVLVGHSYGGMVTSGAPLLRL